MNVSYKFDGNWFLQSIFMFPYGVDFNMTGQQKFQLVVLT